MQFGPSDAIPRVRARDVFSYGGAGCQPTDFTINYDYAAQLCFLPGRRLAAGGRRTYDLPADTTGRASRSAPTSAWALSPHSPSTASPATHAVAPATFGPAEGR